MLAELRAADDEVGRALDGYLELVGCRLLDGFDIAGRYALELPDVLLRAIRTAVDTGGSGGDDAGDPDCGRARPGAGGAPRRVRRAPRRGSAHVPPPRRAWGLQRHLGVGPHAAGRARRGPTTCRVRPRSTTRSTSSTPRADEMAQMVMGADEPSADELAARYNARTSMTGREGPPYLGDPPTPPPDMTGLPPDVIRLMTATGIAIGALFGSSEAEHEENLLRGLAASGGSYEGMARRIAGPHEFDRIEQGDVLVTESTSEAFNILLAAARRDRHGCGWLALALGDRRPRIRDPRCGRHARRDAADPRRRACAGRRRRRRSARARVRTCGEIGRPARRGARRVPLRLQGGRPGRGGAGRTADPARCRAVGRRWSMPSSTARPTRSTRSCGSFVTCLYALAVRSSAADEDGADASFAGQHLTLLNVRDRR